MIVILEGSKMNRREKVHPYLKEKLELPDYYGENLDALWDLLSTDSRNRQIVLTESEEILEGLGNYGEHLLDTLQEAAGENKNLQVEMY